MSIEKMAVDIVKIIDKNYEEYIDDDCLDVSHIKNICNLYKTKSNISHSVSIDDINFSSPEFKRMTTIKEARRHTDILKSGEFVKKYRFFIRIIYFCLRIDIEIFNIDNDIITLKNNYQLIKAFEAKKKSLIANHIEILRNQYKNITMHIGEDYDLYVEEQMSKLKMIDKIMMYINKLIKAQVFGKTDNMLTLILPYFYKYTEYIEEYN